MVIDESELFIRLEQMIQNTGITYKQIDCDLDEEGDVTVFFSGLKKEND